MYERITRYAGRLAGDPGETSGIERDGGRVISMPAYEPSELMEAFQRDFYEGGFADEDYLGTLERAGIDPSDIDMEGLEEAAPDERALLALITFAIRSERFCEGSLEAFARSGILDACLERLSEWDEDAALPARTKQAVEKALAMLEKEPEGASMTPIDCLRDVDGPFPTDEGGGGLFGFTGSLFLHAPEHGLFLDSSAHEGMAEGLPWSLDFVVRHTGRPGR